MGVVFEREAFGQIWFRITASEELGLEGPSYLEDDRGAPGVLTARHQSGRRFSITMAERQDESVPHSVFAGWYPAPLLPNGEYVLLGQLQDRAGNTTYLSDTPQQTGSTVLILFTIAGQQVFTSPPILLKHREDVFVSRYAPSAPSHLHAEVAAPRSDARPPKTTISAAPEPVVLAPRERI